MYCGKVLEGVQLWRDAASGEAGHAEIAPRSPFTAPRLRRDWSWKLSNIYNKEDFSAWRVGFPIWVKSMPGNLRGYPGIEIYAGVRGGGKSEKRVLGMPHWRRPLDPPMNWEVL